VDFAASQFLIDLECRSAEAAAGQPLFQFRDDFRRLIQDQPVDGLVWCLAHGDGQTRLLAVWLLGRCGDTRGIGSVACFLQSRERPFRITVAKALARLHARAELQKLAAVDLDPWIREFAARHAQRSFADKLVHFAPRSRLDPTANEQRPKSRMPFVLNVHPLLRHPPKPAAMIRAILERIRNLLHGPSRVGNGH
jgi:hypothetical protein